MNKKTGKKILFVCTGNTCRSPMAERLLEQTLAFREIKGFAVYSAGIAAEKNAPMNPKSAQVLRENGIFDGEFNSRRIRDAELRNAFAVICMTEQQKDVLLDMRWRALRKVDAIGDEEIANNVYSFFDFCGYDIPDPYGRDIDAYRFVFNKLEGGMSAIIETLGLAKPSKKRGRPKKKTESDSVSVTPKKRGRPKKTENAKDKDKIDNERAVCDTAKE